MQAEVIEGGGGEASTSSTTTCCETTEPNMEKLAEIMSDPRIRTENTTPEKFRLLSPYAAKIALFLN